MNSFLLRRGVNIGGWLSQSKRRGRERVEFFTRDDAARLARMGFNHLRIPVDEEQLWDDAGKREAEAWTLLNTALDWCAEYGLNAVVDLHILRSHYFMAKEKPLFTIPREAERFGELWDELSSELLSRDVARVAYEFMNEPVADRHEDWNRVYGHPYRAIRKRERERVLLLGSNLWSQAGTFEFLEVPADDPNMVLTFHYYNPMHVTHYGAPWVKECEVYTGPIAYPGLPIPQDVFNELPIETQHMVGKWNRWYDRNAIESDLLWPLALAARTGLPLYCGEFGVIHKAPPEIRAAWHRDVTQVFESHGIGWAVWSYKGGFGLLDKDGRSDETARAILGHP